MRVLWVRFSEPASRARGITSTNIFFGMFQKALDDIRWTIDRTEFDELIALKKDSAPSRDGIPYGANECAESLGSQFLVNAENICWKEVPSPNTLLKVEGCSSPRRR